MENLPAELCPGSLSTNTTLTGATTASIEGHEREKDRDSLILRLTVNSAIPTCTMIHSKPLDFLATIASAL